MQQRNHIYTRIVSTTTPFLFYFGCCCCCTKRSTYYCKFRGIGKLRLLWFGLAWLWRGSLRSDLAKRLSLIIVWWALSACARFVNSEMKCWCSGVPWHGLAGHAHLACWCLLGDLWFSWGYFCVFPGQFFLGVVGQFSVIWRQLWNHSINKPGGGVIKQKTLFQT